MSTSGRSPLVGRHRELAAVRRMLATGRVVTLVGPGGVGKSRLAARVSAQRRADSWLVDLDGVADPSRPAPAIADALGLRARQDGEDLDALVRFFDDRACLLVLDQADRTTAEGRTLVAALLDACAGLRVLATSRQPLGLPGERILRLDPLGLPGVGDEEDVEAVGRADAVRLFVERAATVAGGFTLTPANAPAVARLCRELDGLPLAVELAAARVRELPPDALLGRLGDRYRILGRRFRDVPDRLSSLEASVTFSHDLCTPQERLLWARLSVFRGPFESAAAVEVCSGDGLEAEAVEPLLGELVTKSLVLREPPPPPAYHRLLASIREYGAARLADQDDPARWRERHRRWCGGLAEEFRTRWLGPGQPARLCRLRHLHENLVVALEPGDDLALGIALDLEMFWLVGGRLAAGRRWLEHGLASGAGPARLRFEAGCVAACFAAQALDANGARRAAAALAADPPADAGARATLAYTECVVALLTGDPERAQTLGAAGVESARESGNAQRELGLLVALTLAHRAVGDLEASRQALAEARAHADALGGEHGRAYVLRLGAEDALESGDVDTAGQLLRECLALAVALPDDLVTGQVLEGLAAVAAARDDPTAEGRLRGAASRVWRRVGTTPVSLRYAPAQRELANRLERGALDPLFADAFRAGAAAPTDRLAAEILDPASAAEPARDTTALLTGRERQIAALVGEGLSNQQIASRLVISVRTVHGHMENILRKLGFGSRAQVAAWVVRRED